MADVLTQCLEKEGKKRKRRRMRGKKRREGEWIRTNEVLLRGGTLTSKPVMLLRGLILRQGESSVVVTGRRDQQSQYRHRTPHLSSSGIWFLAPPSFSPQVPVVLWENLVAHELSHRTPFLPRNPLSSRWHHHLQWRLLASHSLACSQLELSDTEWNNGEWINMMNNKRSEWAQIMNRQE